MSATRLGLSSCLLGLCCLALCVSLVGCGHTSRSGLDPEIQKHTLENGLEIYLLEDHSAPIFTYQYWVKVGSADEREGQPGITGLSHFFEHMMFRGTPKYPKYFDEIAKRGGKLNAFTWLDVTVYWEKMARADLEFVMDIESDRLRHMRVDFLNLEPEREVVKSERLMRTENSPIGSLREALSATLFTKHSYHWPTVGWMRDLNQISLAEAAAYHKRFYAPNNAFVVLVGDFDSDDALDLIKQYYGGFERVEITREPRTADDPLTAERRTYVEKPTGTGLFMVSYAIPAGSHPDFVALEVIDELLTGGKTSRLQKALVHGDDPLAKSVGSFAFPFVDPSALMLDVHMLPGKTSRLAEERLTAEVAKLASAPVPPSELRRAVARLRGSVVRSMTTTHSRAQLMGFSIRSTGDPKTPWKRLEQYGKVTSADVQRVAAQYLAARNRVVGYAVDVRKLAELVKRFLAVHKSGVEDLDALVFDSTEYATRVASMTLEEASVAQENAAIDALQTRADIERKRLGNDEKALDALTEYLTEGEKGITKRRANLATREAALAEARTGLLTSKDALMKRLRTIEAATRADAVHAETAGARIDWALELLNGNAGRLGRAPDGQEALGRWALRALSLQHFYQKRVPPVASILSAAKPEDGPLLDIFNFAYTAQKLNAGAM